MKKIFIILMSLIILHLYADIDDIELSLPDINVIYGDTFTVPISTSELNGQGVISYQINIDYNESLLQFAGATVEGSLSDGGMINSNAANGQLVVAGIFARPMVGFGDLIFLEFSAIGSGVCDLHFAEAVFNTTSLSQLTDGSVIITGAPSFATLSVSDYIAEPTDTISINIEANDIANSNCISFQFSLNYDPAVLEFLEVDNSNTITADWTIDETCLPGTVRIAGINTEEITTDGTLLTVVMRVEPEAASYSELNLDDVVLNSVTTNNVQNGRLDILADQVVDLISGWNIVSFYNEPDDMDMESIMQPLIDAEALIKVQNESGQALVDLPGVGWYNGIGNMTVTEGYYIKVLADTQLSITGLITSLPLEVQLLSGWNIMGYPCPLARNVATVMQPLIDAGKLVKVQNESGQALVNLPGIGWYNGIGDFQPGEGYYVNVNSETTLTIAKVERTITTAHKLAVSSNKVPCEYFSNVWSNNPYKPMNVFVKGLKNTKVEIGDEIAIFDQEHCVGSTVVTSLDFVSIISSADDPNTNEIDGFKTNKKVEFRVWDKSEKHEIPITDYNLVKGENLFVPLGTALYEFAEEFNHPEKITRVKLDNYPNPFNPSTFVSFTLPTKADVELTVYDLKGRRVKKLVDEKLNIGLHRIEWLGQDEKGSKVGSGVYLYKLKINNVLKAVNKCILLK